jgi:tetratricopeptide (TPR) repeat protein
MYEFLFKSLAATVIVDALTGDDTERDTRHYRLLNTVLRDRFQRPVFGDWIAAYRHANQSVSRDRRAPASIGTGADAVIGIRNRLAHGITPGASDAGDQYGRLRPILDRIVDYYKSHGVEVRFARVAAGSPFGNGPTELYNGIRNRKRIEYLDYVLGAFVLTEGLLDFREYFQRHLRGGFTISDDEVLSLLGDYFPREYWEERISRAFRSWSGTVLVGDNGIGKTTLVARTAQRFNCGMFRFREADRSPGHAVRGFHALYASLRREIGNVPQLPDDIGIDELAPALSHLANRSAREGWEHFFVFDAINELAREELSMFEGLLGRLRDSGIHILASTRNRHHMDFFSQALGDTECIQLEPLTELEIKEWITARSSEIHFPSPGLLGALSRFSGGSFLILQSLPRDRPEEEYRKLADTTPASVEAAFRKMTAELGTARRIVLFISTIPGAVSRELIRAMFDLTPEQTVQELDAVDAVVRETAPGVYELFHTKYREYLVASYPDERKRLFHRTVENIGVLSALFQQYSDIPVLFVQFGALAQLQSWITDIVQTLPAIRQTDRYAYACAASYGFSILAKHGRLLPEILDVFIDRNFQLLIDWNLASEIVDDSERYRAFSNGSWVHIALLQGCVAYTKNDTETAIAVLEGVDPDALGLRDRRRRLDYLGLSYRKNGQFDQAIEAFTGVLEVNEPDGSDGIDATDVWTGYALTNRGKTYLSAGRNREAIQDIVRAVEIRRRVAFDPVVFEMNRDDLGSETQAVLTLAMGYENLMRLHEATGNVDAAAEASHYAESLVRRSLDSEPRQTMDFRFCGRIMIAVTEFRLRHDTDSIADDTAHLLSLLFVRADDISRYQAVIDALQGVYGRPLDDLLDELRAIDTDYTAAEMSDDEIRIGILETRIVRVAGEITSSRILIERLSARTGMSPRRIQRKLTLEGLGSLLEAVDG